MYHLNVLENDESISIDRLHVRNFTLQEVNDWKQEAKHLKDLERKRQRDKIQEELEESRKRKRLWKARKKAEREREWEDREVEEPQEADAAFENLLVDADNGLEERIDNKTTQVAPIIKVGYRTSQLAHRLWSLQDKYFGKSCP